MEETLMPSKRNKPPIMTEGGWRAVRVTDKDFGDQTIKIPLDYNICLGCGLTIAMPVTQFRCKPCQEKQIKEEEDDISKRHDTEEKKSFPLDM